MPSPTPVVAIENGAYWSPSTTVTNNLYYIHIIHISFFDLISPKDATTQQTLEHELNLKEPALFLKEVFVA